MENRRPDPDPDLSKGSVPEGWSRRSPKRPPARIDPVTPAQASALIILAALGIMVLNEFWWQSDFVLFGCLGAIGVRILWLVIYSAVRAARRDSNNSDG